MKNILISLLLLMSLYAFGQEGKYKQELSSQTNYTEGANSGTVNIKVVFDVFFGEPTVAAIAKLESFEGCKPYTLNLSVDIYDGARKVSTRTFTNLISFDVKSSPDWDEIFPGLSEEQAKDLYKRGFSIRNPRMVDLKFEDCASNTEDAQSTGASTNSSSVNAQENTGTSNSSEETKAQEEEERRAAEKAAEEEATARAKAAEDQRQKEIEAEQAKRQAEAEAARKEQERRAENLRKKQEYDRKVAEQRDRNVQQAGAMAASNLGAMAAIAMVVYADMGKVKAENTYYGNQLALGIDMGYSLSSMPLVFNSSRTTYIYNYNTGNNQYVTSTEDDDRRASTINLEFKPFIGYEHDNWGFNAYGCFQPGISLIIDRYNISHYYGGEVFGGIGALKFFYEYRRGNRKMGTIEWIDPEEFGDGIAMYKYKQSKLGLRITFENTYGSYARHHLKFGLIYENFLEALEHEHGKTRMWYYNLNPEKLGNPNKYYRIFGYHFSWNKEHNFNFYMNVYPNHPIVGVNKYSNSDSFKERETGAPFVEIGFVRQIKAFF
ncbi:hypothetical protein SAMN05216474_1221 [Lishizhenia tianjinensis]|uniref:Uncharacterized protein n=1 Tax=Lishizhenia tianjinensis TaxID=477690 RepID=A0A1I6YW48_9FLAO|nr:cell envelope integrity protein TolA [Lishizhenia tianjinensis]SFT54518.1 hypothetical protein SAMN05216474_1221 [Lishizhenia tianjinensis]